LTVRFFAVLFEEVRRFRAGTLPPFSRASLNPMAMACLRLVTLRPEPLFKVPDFRRFIAEDTRFFADPPYLAIGRPPGFPGAKPVLVAALPAV
jgi:hypothetical protein